MNQSGLKEPDFENRRKFSKKAREPYYAFKNLRLSTFPNHGQLTVSLDKSVNEKPQQ